MPMTFRPISIDDYDSVYAVMSRYGEGSCQHSFVSMYSLFEKYGDSVSESDGFLYVLRSRLCDDAFRVYLAPFGEGDLRQAYRNILDDAHAHGVRARFVTLTEKHAQFVAEAFPGLFQIVEDRDLAEYIYRTDQMASFAGGKLAKRRKETHQFWHTYGSRASVRPITPDDFHDILAFEEAWLTQNGDNPDFPSLKREARVIARQLADFERLRLSGVVMRIDGSVRGYGYGVKLSEDCYDALIEKGDRSLTYAYRVLRQESVKQCAMAQKYVNLEEDLGIEGLRALKTAYQPEFLLRKFVATEIPSGDARSRAQQHEEENRP